jgi:hypothetical protein
MVETSDNFGFQSIIEASIALWDEGVPGDKQMNEFKRILGGTSLISRKGKAAVKTPPKPFVICNNVPVWSLQPQEAGALKARMFHYKCQGVLSALREHENMKVNPWVLYAWFNYCEMYSKEDILEMVEADTEDTQQLLLQFESDFPLTETELAPWFEPQTAEQQ